jgi:hypothetical protein
MCMYLSYTLIPHHIPTYDVISRYMVGYQGVRIPDGKMYIQSTYIVCTKHGFRYKQCTSQYRIMHFVHTPYVLLTFDIPSISMYGYVQTCTDIQVCKYDQVHTLFIVGHGHTRYEHCTYEYERVHPGCQVSRCDGTPPGDRRPGPGRNRHWLRVGPFNHRGRGRAAGACVTRTRNCPTESPSRAAENGDGPGPAGWLGPDSGPSRTRPRQIKMQNDIQNKMQNMQNNMQ